MPRAYLRDLPVVSFLHNFSLGAFKSGGRQAVQDSEFGSSRGQFTRADGVATCIFSQSVSHKHHHRLLIILHSVDIQRSLGGPGSVNLPPNAPLLTKSPAMVVRESGRSVSEVLRKGSA